MPDEPETPDLSAYVPLAPAALHIVLSLNRGERHGYAIMGDVDRLSDGVIKLGPGTLYGTIKRMVASDLIEESGRRPAPEDDDTRRRYYTLTQLGRQVVTLEAERLQLLVGVARDKQVLG